MGRVLLLSACALFALGFGCSRDGGGGDAPLPGSRSGGPPSRAPEGVVSLTGAGATFPYPLYTKWIAEFGKLRPDVRVNYQSIGSGGGIRQILEQTVDFGASDAPMPDEQLGRSPDIVHIPTCLGAVVLAYNLPGVAGGLKLTPDAIAGIFLGKLTSWRDPALAGENPDVALPDKPIVAVHRSDGSGTTKVFVDYLSTVSPAWRSGPGTGTSVDWPLGLGAKGNEGVSATVAGTPFAIGYVELAYAAQNGMTVASVRNRAGRYVAPGVESTTAAAAAAAPRIPDDLRTSIVDPDKEDAYPIGAFTYVLVHDKQKDAARGKALVEFLAWALDDGQRLTQALHYAPLPAEIAAKARTKVARLQGPDGRPLLAGRGGGR